MEGRLGREPEKTDGLKEAGWRDNDEAVVVFRSAVPCLSSDAFDAGHFVLDITGSTLGVCHVVCWM